MTLHKLLTALALAAAPMLGSACIPSTVQVSAGVTPRLVWVEPGIWLVEDYPYPVYYADGYYWRQIDGYWYRSGYYNTGFVQVGFGFVPRIVIGAYRPVHVRYRAPAHVQSRPIIRDHRTPRPRRR